MLFTIVWMIFGVGFYSFAIGIIFSFVSRHTNDRKLMLLNEF